MEQATKISNNWLKLSLIAYAALYFVSIVLLKTYEVRPTIYYVVIAALSTLILIEILAMEVSNDKALIIIAQIALLALNLIWGVTLKYYYYSGFTDIFGHVGFAESLLQTGFVTDVFGVYKPFPLWHILANYFYLFSGWLLSMNKVMYILSGIVFLFMLLAIYLLSEKIFGKKIALLATLIASFYTPLVSYGMYSIPRSAEAFFFVVLMLLLLERADKAKYYVAIFMVFTILVFHTASIIYVLLILIMVFIIERLMAKGDKNYLVTTDFLIISAAMTFVYWELYANTLINTLLSDIMSPASSGPKTLSVYTEPMSEFFNYLQNTPTLLLVIFGILLALGFKQFNNKIKVLSLVSLILVPVSFPGPLLLVNKLAGNFNFGRFEEYTFAFVILMAAMALSVLYFKANKFFKVCIITIFAVWVMLSISNDFVALDNPIIKRPFYTNYLTQEEVSDIDHVSDMAARLVLSDYITVRYLNSSQLYANTSMLRVDQNNTKFIKRPNDVILVRDGELEKRPLQFLTSNADGYILNLGYYYYKGHDAYSLFLNRSKIYSADTVTAYN
jgi:hypothetical protein